MENYCLQCWALRGQTGMVWKGWSWFMMIFLVVKNKKIITPRDARGRPLFVDVGISLNRSRGSDIYLTIDSDLQFVFRA